MNYTLHAQSGRWLSAIERAPSGSSMRKFSITVRPNNDQPDPRGQQTIDNFFTSLNANWSAVLNALERVDSTLTPEIIEASIKERVYLFAPALVGSQWHDLLILFDFSLPDARLAGCIICIDNGAITSAEVQY